MSESHVNIDDPHGLLEGTGKKLIQAALVERKKAL